MSFKASNQNLSNIKWLQNCLERPKERVLQFLHAPREQELLFLSVNHKKRNVNLKKLRDSSGQKLIEYIKKNSWLSFTRMKRTYSPNMVHYSYSTIHSEAKTRY